MGQHRRGVIDRDNIRFTSGTLDLILRQTADMAIEFHCPYCTATIRVPDEFSGKRGSCPKCSTRLIVPTIQPPPVQSTPDAVGPTDASGSVSVPDTMAVSDLPGVTPQSPVAVPGPSEPGSIPPLMGQPPLEAAAELASLPVSPLKSTSLRRKARRKKSQRVYALAIPIGCFVMFFGVVGIIMMMQKPELKGTLRGTIARRMEIPSRSVSLAQLELTTDEEAQTALAFETDPESFVSSQMTCRIQLDGSALAIELQAGSGFSWFTVNPSTDLTLAEWIRDNTVAINTARLRQMTDAGKELCRDKILKASGTPVVFDAEKYRDGFGLNAHVGAFGYVVEAVTKNRRTPCAHEDTKGILYFALPDDTQEFRLRGRSVGSGSQLFPGEYVVQVSSSEATSPSTEPAVDAQNETDMPTDTEPMSDGEMETPPPPETEAKTGTDN